MIREDRLLLTDLARLNRDVAPLAMRIMDHTATVEEHYAFAERLATMALRLQARGAHMGKVIEGEVATGADVDVARRGWRSGLEPRSGRARPG